MALLCTALIPGDSRGEGGEKDAGRIYVFEAFLTVVKVWTTRNDMTRRVDGCLYGTDYTTKDCSGDFTGYIISWL